MPTKYLESIGKWRGYWWKGRSEAYVPGEFDTQAEAHQAYLDALNVVNPTQWHRVTGEPELERKCLMCEEVKPIEEFQANSNRNKHRGNVPYRYHYCKVCWPYHRQEVRNGVRDKTPGRGFAYRKHIPPPPAHDEAWYMDRIEKLKVARQRLIDRLDLGPYEKVKRGKRIDQKIKFYWAERRRAMLAGPVGGFVPEWNMDL